MQQHADENTSVHAHARTWMWPNDHAHNHVHMHACMLAWMHAHTCISAHIRTQAHMHNCACTYRCGKAHTNTHLHAHTQTHIHTNTLFHFRALRTHAAAGQTHERLQARQTTLGGQPTSDLAMCCATRLAKLQRGMYFGTSPASCSRIILWTGMVAGAAGATTLAGANRQHLHTGQTAPDTTR